MMLGSAGRHRSLRRPRFSLLVSLCIAALVLALLGAMLTRPVLGAPTSAATGWEAQLHDDSDGKDWPAFGRTYGEQHYSPLTQINTSTVARLGLVWSFDLPPGNSATGPIEVAGTLYFASGYSIVHAIDAATGRLLWSYDPQVPEVAGQTLRQGWGSRGIAYWNGKIFTGTGDGRLIAVDARSGRPVWSVRTFAQGEPRYITGAPRVFDGMVIIGHGGADVGAVRGYVTAYDAETGQQRWRFYTVPGNPSDGFENAAMAMAAKTWAGDWWHYGGGGTVWNAITYDRETDSIYLGTGNGAPWNRRIRSQGKGDNLFLSSIVALDAKTGAYKWHYQTNPGESWDYNAAMDMELAEMRIGGRLRQVLITAPKNGFLYVIDRTDGKLISAAPYVPTTWAKRIDLVSGRPVEAPNIRFETGPVMLRPSPTGAHSWMPMAFNPALGLVYIPAIDIGATVDDRGITVANWKRPGGMAMDTSVNLAMAMSPADRMAGYLVAWNPATQQEAWRRPLTTFFSGGVLATGGGLVFQGHPDASFTAYDGRSGTTLWNFDARAGIIGPPISYRVGGRQYVTVITGVGTSAGLYGAVTAKLGIDYRTQARRVLTFALDGKTTLPPAMKYTAVAADDPSYVKDVAAEQAGFALFNMRCAVCHGGAVVGGGVAPDLRTSPIPMSAKAFESVVHGGALVPNGMPQFGELPPSDLDDIRQYIRSSAALLRVAARDGKSAHFPDRRQ